MSAVAAARSVPRITYASIVWGQLRKNPIAAFGLWAIATLFLLAIYLPLFCLNAPIMLVDASGLHLPMFGELFNRLLFENAVDIFFNLLMVLSPLYLLAFWLGRAMRIGTVRLLVVLCVLHGLAFAAMTPERLGGARNPLYHRAPLTDWYEQVGERRAAGESITAVFPLYPKNYRSTDPTVSVQPPGADHWLGTDVEGRDVLARMLYGIRISLTIGVVAVAIFVAIGVVLGALAGYLGGQVDLWISRLIEVMICFPSFFLILTLAALITERSIFHVMVIIGITSWSDVARLVRAEFLKQKNLDYVQAARALGLSRLRIMFRHVLPNAMAPVLVTATFGVASAILIESSLAFLGIGDPSASSWGALLNTGREQQKLWLILVPGFAIFFVVSVFNLVGEGLRDALDPQLRI